MKRLGPATRERRFPVENSIRASPIVVISGLSADEALEAEATFIAVIGRRSNATGPLYNQTAGWGLGERLRHTRLNTEACLTASLRRRNPATTPRPPKSRLMTTPRSSNPPPQAPPSWVKPLSPVSDEQHKLISFEQTQRLRKALTSAPPVKWSKRMVRRRPKPK